MLPSAVHYKKALLSGAFFIGLVAALLLVPAAPGHADCAADRIDEYAAVAWVHDGDTLTLKDGRRVRFIGVNAPEVAHAGEPGQAYGPEARAALKSLLPPDTPIGLRYDEIRLDKYGRTLAHIYLKDGTSVESWLLERGLAMAVVTPPDIWNHECYRTAELSAAHKQIGLWTLPDYRPADTHSLDTHEHGLRVIRGKITHIGDNGGQAFINLAGDVTLYIAPEDHRYFTPDLLTSLRNRQIIAKGWLHMHRGRLNMRIRHPDMLEVVNE